MKQSFRVFLSEKRHFSLLFLRDIFTGCKILYYHYFPSSILKMSFYCPLHCIVSDETSVVIFIIVLVCSMSFSLTTFKTFSLSLVLSSFNMVCLDAVFFLLILPVVHWLFWIWGFRAFISFGKSLTIITHIFFLPYSFLGL